MKKKLIALLLVLFVFGATTIAFAQVDENSDWNFTFEQMLPFMQKMHPSWSVDELQQMFQGCSTSNGCGSGGNSQSTSARMMGF